MATNNIEQNRRKLYDALVPRIGDIGTWDEFNNKLNDESNRRKLYDALAPRIGDIGTWDEFNGRIYQAPELSQPVQTVQQAQPQQQTSTIRPATSSAAKFNVGDTFTRGGKVYRLERFEEDGSASVQPDGSLTLQRMTLDELNDSTPYEAWEPSDAQRAQMSDEVDASLHRFNASSTAGGQRLQNTVDYATSSAAISGKPMKGDMTVDPNTGRMEQAYITPQGDETTDYAAAADAVRDFRAEQFAVSLPGRIQATQARIADLQSQIQDRIDELAAESREREADKGLLSRIMSAARSAEGGIQDDGDFTETLKTDGKLNTLRLSLRQATEQMEVLDNNLNQQENGGRRFWHDFFRATGQAISDSRAWDFGYGDMRDALTTMRIASKSDRGIELDDAERDAMVDIAMTNEVLSQFGDLGRGYRWGDITGTSLSFMKDFMLTGGFSGTPALFTKGMTKLATKAGAKFATEVAKRAAGRGLMQFVKTEGLNGVGALVREQALPWAVKALGTTVDDLVVRAPLMAATVQGMATTSKVIEHKLGGVEYDPETGSFSFENGETWSNAIWQAGADQVIENFSEMWGAHLPGLTNVTKTFGARNLTAAILRSTREGAGTVVSKAANFLKRAGVNGYLGEVGEEYYGQAWRTMLGLDSAHDENGQNLFKSGQFHGDIWGGMALSIALTGGGIMAANAGVKYAGNVVDYYTLRNAVNRSDSRANEALTPEIWEPMRMIIDATDNDNIGTLAEQVCNDQSMTDLQKAAVMDYMESSMMMRGHNLREFVTRQSDEESAGRTAMADAYREGINIESANDRNRARMSLNYQSEQLRNVFNITEDANLPDVLAAMYGSDDLNAIVSALYSDKSVGERERTAIVDYLTASNRYNGMIQAAYDAIENDVAATEEFIDVHSDRSSAGNPIIRPAKLKTGDGPVYIIGGHVQMLPDGTMVDTANSDNFIIIREATGAVSTIDAADIESLGEVEPVQAAKERMAGIIRESRMVELQKQINGVVTVNIGDMVPVETDSGVIEAQVTGFDENDNVAVTFPNGTQGVTTRESIQTITDSLNDEAFRSEIEQSTATTNENSAALVRSESTEDIMRSRADKINAGASIAVDENGDAVGTWMPIDGVAAANDEEYSAAHHLLAPQVLDMGIDPKVAIRRRGNVVEVFIPTINTVSETTESASYEIGADIEFADPTGASDNRVAGRIVDIDRSNPVEPQYIVEYETADGQKRILPKSAVDLSPLNATVAENVAPETTVVENTDTAVDITIPGESSSEETSAGTGSVAGDIRRSALEQIPQMTMTDKKTGQQKQVPNFTAVEPGLAWDAIVETTGGDVEMAQTYANNQINIARKVLDKAQKAKPQEVEDITEFITSERQRKQAIADAQTQLDAWVRIAAEIENRRREEERRRDEEVRAAAESLRKQEEAERERRDEETRILAEELNGVPEWTTDTPADARRRGHRRVAGTKVERQGEIPAVIGKEVDVNFAKGRTEKGHAVLIDASQAQPSHLQGSVNPLHFIPEAQPKDRNDGGVSTMAADDIAREINPRQITATDVTAYVGAPTVNRRGEVIQGNNRVDALRLMWERYPEQAARYKQYLIDNADSFGLNPADIEAMERPILTNMLKVDDDAAIKLGQYTGESVESGGEVRLSPTHLTTQMGKAMPAFVDMLLRSSDESVTLAQMIDDNGLEVFKWLLANKFITPTQYKTALDSRSGINGDAKNDLKGVLFESVFRGGAQTLKDMFANLPVAAQNAILSTAFRDQQSPRGENMLAEIQESIVAYNMMMTSPQMRASKNLEQSMMAMHAWKMQTQFDDISGEPMLPSERFSNFALQLAAMYHKCTQRTLQGIFNGMFDLVQGTAQPTLFEEAPSNESIPLAEAIKRVLGIEYQPVNNKDNNGQIRDNDVAVDTPASETRQPGGTADTDSGEQTPAGTEPSDRGAGVADDSSAAGERGDVQPSDERQGDLSQGKSEEITYQLSNEVDEDGSPFVLSSNGNTDFGVIPQESGLISAPIKLSLGNSKYGLIHLMKRHGDEIRKTGFESVESFVEYVANNFSLIREGENSMGEANGTYLLQLEDEHNNTLYVELSTDGSYWGVNSGGVFRKGYGKNKKEVWSASEEQNKQSATDNTLRTEVYTDNPTAPNGTVSNTSDDKDTTLSSDKQISDEESFTQAADDKQTPAGTEPSDRGAGAKDDRSAAGRNTDVRGGNTDDAANGELAERVTPSVGPFGEIYTQFKGKPQEAVTFLLAKRSGEAIGALHHKDIGDIDLVWGKEGTAHSDGYGLAKLAKFHPEVLFNLQEVLNDMVVTKRSTNRVQLESDKYQAAVRLTWDNKKKTWLLTMFEKKNSVPDNTTDTVETLSSNGNDTATPENTVISSDVRSVPAVGEGIYTDTSEVNSGQTEGATAPAGNSSQTSDSKDNKSLTEEQISGEESSEQNPDDKGAERVQQSVQASVQAASAEVNTEPTPAQAEAGNYKKGHVTIGDFDITIENPAGSIRKGVDADGKEWQTTMANTYGYIRGTESVDGDHIDVFLHTDMDEWDGRKVFVVDQTNADGSFDEHKVMLGFNDKDMAMSAYLANYDATWAEKHPGLRISEVSIEDFNKWIQSSHRKTKPFADYATVSKISVDEIIDKIEETESDRAPLSIADMMKAVSIMYDTQANKEADFREVEDNLMRADAEISDTGQKASDDLKADIEAEYEADDEMVEAERDAAFLPNSVSGSEIDFDTTEPSRPDNRSKWISDEDADEFDILRSRLRGHLDSGQDIVQEDAPTYGNKKSPSAIRQDLTTSSLSPTDAAKLKIISDNLRMLAQKLSGTVDKHGVFTDLARAIGAVKSTPDSSSDYVQLQLPNGKNAEIRISNHNANAENFAKRGKFDGNISIVIKSKRSHNTFRAHPEVELTEYVYTTEAIKSDSNLLSLIAESLRHMIETGEYADLSGRAIINRSPEVDAVQEDAPSYGKPQPKQMDAEILCIGTRITYLMMKGGLRKFSDYVPAMIEELGDAIRPHLKSLYAAAQNIEEVIDLGWDEEMDDRQTVKAFDVYNFDKSGAKDIVGMAQHIVDEEQSEQQTRQIVDALKENRNEKRKQKEGKKPLAPVGNESLVDVAKRASANAEEKQDAEQVARYRERTGELAHILDFESESFEAHDVIAGINELQDMWEEITYNYGENPSDENAAGTLSLIESELQRWRHKDIVVAESNSAIENVQPHDDDTMHSDADTERSVTDRSRTSAVQQGIQDWGEDIWGARKNALRELVGKLSGVSVEDLIVTPLSKIFKPLDWSRMAQRGDITPDDALMLGAITQLILRDGKPRIHTRNQFARRRSESAIRDWAVRTTTYIEKMRELCEATTPQARQAAIAGLDLRDMAKLKEDRRRLLEMNEGREDGGLYSPSEVKVMAEVLQGLGYPVNAVGKAKFATIDTDHFGTCYEVRLGDKYYGRYATYDEAVGACVKIAKASRGDSDVEYTPNDIRSSVRIKEQRPTGTWVVRGLRGTGVEEVKGGLSESEAKALAEQLRSKTKREHMAFAEKESVKAYAPVVQDPVTRKRISLEDVPEFETAAECNAWIADNLESLQDKANNAVSAQYADNVSKRMVAHVQVYADRQKDGTYSVWMPLSKGRSNAMGNMVVLARGFSSHREAMRWAEANREAIDKREAAWKEARRKFVFFKPAVPRKGVDYRKGRNVTEAEVGETFGFRGVQFGNWTNQRDRQQSLNEAYDALMDLSSVVGISPRAIGLNGELGLAFGARGTGRANAHYESGSVVINLTKTRGAGSLAHEWWHALDNYFARRGGVKTGWMTEGIDADVRREVRTAFAELAKVIKGSAYDRRCAQRGGGYWDSVIEESARLFAEWVDRRLLDNGGKNSFLSSGVDAEIAEAYRRMNYDLYTSQIDEQNKDIARRNEELAESELIASVEPMSYEEFKATEQALAEFMYPTDEEIEHEFDAPLRRLFDTIEQIDINGTVALNEPAAQYDNNVPDIKKKSNFASRYETSDGKQVNYISENPDAYLGGLFGYDSETENGVSKAGNMRSGAGDVQRQGDTRLLHSDSRLNEGEGEFSRIERVFTENGSFNFTTGERIESADDVAFIFSALEDAAKEHAFCVFVKDGQPTVVELGMGTFTATMVDVPTASLAYNRIRPDEVYFVHNHPSGNLICSPQDVECLKKIASISDVPVHGVIINLKTGHYGTFDTAGNKGTGTRQTPEKAVPLTVHTLDKQIFAPDYDPMVQPLANSSQAVASFLNSHRMGDRAKVSFLVVTRANRIVGNIHTPFTDITNVREVARYIADRVTQFGGASAILYGDFEMSAANGQDYMRLKKEMQKHMNGNDPGLLDVVRIEGNHTRSAFDEGLIYEPGSDYGPEIQTAEIERIVAEAKAAGKYMLAPNGNPSNLSEKQWAQVRTAAFKKWFGDWESHPGEASKIVDENGEPLVLYHGTSEDFHTFEHGKIGLGGQPSEQEGFYFALKGGAERYSTDGRMLSVFLNMRRPYYTDSLNVVMDTSRFMQQFTQVRANGEDGIVMMNEGRLDDNSEFVVWNPNQIKSADNNDGNYSSDNDDIRYSGREAVYRDSEAFDKLLQRAVSQKGIVMAGLSETTVDVVDVPRHDFKGVRPISQARRWAKDNIVGEHKLIDTDGVEVPYSISARAIDKYLSSSAIAKSTNLGVHLSVLKQLPEVIGTSIEVEVHPDYNKGDDGVRRVENGYNPERLIHRFYGAVRIDDGVYRVKTTIIEFLNDKLPFSPHSFEVTNIELLEESNSSKMEPTVSPNESGAPVGLAKLLHGVEKSYDSGIKILDASPEHPSELTKTKEHNAKMSELEQNGSELAARLHTPVRFIGNIEDVTDTNIAAQRKKRKAKGWYDISTGEVVVVLPNCENVADVEATIFHEVVGHKGLREVIGNKNFAQFLNEIYEHTNKATRANINALMVKNGWNVELATEEYIAHLAEKGFEDMDSQDLSFWAKVKAKVLDFLSRLFKGHKIPKSISISDNEIRYMLWRTYQQQTNGTLIGEAENVLMQQRMGVGRFRFSNTADYIEHHRAVARSLYERRVSTSGYQFREAFQDSMLGLRRLYEAIEYGTGEKRKIEDIPSFENAYIAENALSSLNLSEMDAYERLVMQPLLDAIARLARNERERNQLMDYMMAKHGLERNVYMRREAIANNEDSDRDFAGLTGLTGEQDWQSAEKSARQMVDDYEQFHSQIDIDALWERVNDATKTTLQKIYESGLLSKEQFDKISQMYEYYIPLRGWDETTSDDVYGYLTSRDGAFSSPIKKAEGRSSKSDDPIATIANMAGNAIIQGNRNRMKQRFLNYVLNHPSDLVSVNRLWIKYDEVADEWIPVFADIDANDTPDEVETKIADFEQKMKALRNAEPDKYKCGREASRMPYKVVKGNLREHQVIVKRGGEDYVLTINGNPRAAQAINGMTNPDNEMKGGIGDALKGAQWVNRQLSNFYTTRNPDFVVSNFIRDAFYSNSMVWIKESPRYALRFHKNFAKVNPAMMMRLLTLYRNNNLDLSNPTHRMFHEFMMNGGETGYTMQKDMEQQKKAIKKALKKSRRGRISAATAWEWLGEKLDDINRGVENCARFATFITSREVGRDVQRSVFDAKEISVNFNKKGAGAKYLDKEHQSWLMRQMLRSSDFGRVGFVFWNAAIQGATNFGKNAKRHPVKALTAATALFMLGVLVAAMGGSGDDDASAYFNQPEYVRRSNMMFKYGKQWVCIPLPVEYRAIYGMGELFTSVATGKEEMTDLELANKMVAQISQLMPLDFMEGGGGWHAFLPSSIKPVWEAYVSEKGWTGLPLYKDTPYNKNMPEWTKAYSSANSQLVGLSAWCNRFSGGTHREKGWADFNPAKVEYLLKGYFGGYANVADKFIKTGETIFGDREYDPRSFLLVNRVLKSGDERTAYRKLTNDFFRYKEDAERTKDLLLGYTFDEQSGIEDVAERISLIYNGDDYLRMEIYERFRETLNLYDEAVDAETEESSRKELETMRNVMRREFVNAMRSPGAYLQSNGVNPEELRQRRSKRLSREFLQHKKQDNRAKTRAIGLNNSNS